MKMPVTVVIPMLNSETTIIKAVESIMSQEYPIKEIIIIDNVSKDSSVALIENFKKIEKKIKITLLKHKVNKAVGGSLNEGTRMAKTPYVVFMHSDSVLFSKKELTKLMKSVQDAPTVVASAPIMLHPRKVWEKYNFWQKCLFARVVDKEIVSGNGKFDCYKKDAFLLVGGYDVVNFGHHIGIGSEDADLHIRLREIGKIAVTEAKVIHLHYLSNDYSFWNLMANRKFMGRSYGRLLRFHAKRLGFINLVIFGVKPGLALVGFIPMFFPFNIIMLFLYAIFSMDIMYRTKNTLIDPKILLLPIVSIFFLYYEVFWMIQGFFARKKQFVQSKAKGI